MVKIKALLKGHTCTRKTGTNFIYYWYTIYVAINKYVDLTDIIHYCFVAQIFFQQTVYEGYEAW